MENGTAFLNGTSPELHLTGRNGVFKCLSLSVEKTMHLFYEEMYLSLCYILGGFICISFFLLKFFIGSFTDIFKHLKNAIYQAITSFDNVCHTRDSVMIFCW